MDDVQKRLDEYMQKNNLELAGHVGVNTGSIIIVDPSEVLDDVRYQQYLDLDDKSYKNGKFYFEVFKGVQSSTGYGDGHYPVFVSKNDEGRIMEVRIRFDLTYGFDEKDGPMKYIVVDELWNKVLERQTGKDPLA